MVSEVLSARFGCIPCVAIRTLLNWIMCELISLQIAQLKTDMSVNEQQFRSKLQSLQRQNAEYVEQMANKAREVTQLQKQLNRRDKKDTGNNNNNSSPAMVL